MKKILLIIFIFFITYFIFGYNYVTVPNSFSANQIAKSAQVNANYTALINGVSDGTKKINVAEVYLNSVRIIQNDGTVNGANATFSGTLGVTGNATIDGTLGVAGTLDVSGNIRCMVALVTTINLIDSVEIIVTWDSEIYDVGNMVNTASAGQKIVIPATGNYIINCTARFQSTNSRRIYTYKYNYSDILQESFRSTIFDEYESVSQIVRCNTNDYIIIKVWCTTSGTPYLVGTSDLTGLRTKLTVVKLN